ncbi:metallophosphoesterase [Isobaculum melis]|nr:metallophosphoesterase [Isobaculum melis]
MRNLIFGIIITVFGFMHYYVGHKLAILLDGILPFNTDILIAMLFACCAVSTLATYLLSDKNVGGFIGKLGSYWLGIILTSLVLFGLTDLLLQCIHLFKKDFNPADQLSIGLPLIVIIGVFIYGVWHAKQLKTTEYQITIDKKSDLASLNIVMFSDIHLGYINDAHQFEKIVSLVNEQQPDLILIPGDLFDGNFEAVQEPDRIMQLFHQLKAKYGVYLSWGNHDAGANFDKMKAFIKDSNITLLEDELILIENKLAIAGRKDISPIGNQNEKRKEMAASLAEVDASIPLIVLDHQPSTIHDYEENVDLIVAGHTHQGQVFPFSLVTRLAFAVDYGYYQTAHHNQVIVTSGAKTWGPPMRIGTNCEIVKIKVTFQ